MEVELYRGSRYGFELVERTDGRFNMPPDLCVDGQRFHFGEGAGEDFFIEMEPINEARLPVMQAGALVLNEAATASHVTPTALSEAFDRLFNPSSILYQRLPTRLQSAISVVSSSHGFRREIRQLLAWMDEPDEHITTRVVESERMYTIDHLNTDLARMIATYGADYQRDVFMIDDEEGRFLSYHMDLKGLIIDFLVANPDRIASNIGRRYTNRNTIWRRYAQQINSARRASIFLDMVAALPDDQRYNFYNWISKEDFTPEFEVYISNLPAGSEDTDDEILLSERRVAPADGELAAALEDMPNAIITARERQRGRRRHRYSEKIYEDPLGPTYEFTLESLVRRRDLQAVLSTSEARLATSTDRYASRIYGAIVVACLFHQDSSGIPQEDLDAVARVDHADPIKRASQRAALSIILSVYHEIFNIAKLENKVKELAGADSES